MTTASPALAQIERAIYDDRLVVDGDRVVIEAAHENRDWVVSRYRPVAVDLPEGRFALRSAEAIESTRWRYELTRWENADGDAPSLEVTYDAAYVDARDRLHRASKLGDVASVLTAPLVLLLGFLPSGVKQSLALRVAFEPRAATMLSLTIQRLAIFALAALMVVHWSTGSALTSELDGGGFVLAVLLVDWMLRFSAMQDESARPLGLLEWLWPGSWDRG